MELSPTLLPCNPMRFQSKVRDFHNVFLLILPLDSNLQALSQVRLQHHCSASQSTPWSEQMLPGEKWFYTCMGLSPGLLSFSDGNSSLHFQLPALSWQILFTFSHLFSAGCLVGMTCPPLLRAEVFHFTGAKTETWYKELPLNKFKAELQTRWSRMTQTCFRE